MPSVKEIVSNIQFKNLMYKNKFKTYLRWLIDWLFYGASTLFGSFNAESSHLDESLFQGLLVVWVLWYINLCRLFNAK